MTLDFLRLNMRIEGFATVNVLGQELKFTAGQ